jgi:hypothetical protein
MRTGRYGLHPERLNFEFYDLSPVKVIGDFGI